MKRARLAWALMFLGAAVACAGSVTPGGGGGGGGGRSSAASGGDAGSAESGGTPGAAQCPDVFRADEGYPHRDLCEACPGMECTGSGVTCSNGWHASGSPWSSECQCVDGHMACCGGPKGIFPTCAYGSQARPACPELMPSDGEACGSKPMYCGYLSSCCDEQAAAACVEGTWQVDCFLGRYAGAATSLACEGGAGGEAGAGGAGGAGGAAGGAAGASFEQ